MTKRSFFVAALVAFLLLPVTAVAQENPEAKRLHELFAEDWEWGLADNPVTASFHGDRRWNDSWSDRSLAAYEKRDVHRKGMLEKLEAIDRSSLSKEDKLNYDLFRSEMESALEASRYLTHLLPMNQRNGIQTMDSLGRRLPFQTVADYDDWLARLRAFPAYTKQIADLMREGIERKVLWPRGIMSRVPAQLDKHIVEDPTTSPFWSPFGKVPDAIESEQRSRIDSEARKVILESVVPAYQEFKTFFVDEYLPACPEAVGVWTMPDGEKFYASRARHYTTTDLTPEEIHALGLREVARIREAMETIKTEVGFKGTLLEFFEELRTNPKHYYETPEELLEAYRALSKRIDPEIVRLVKTHPRAPYGVIPIPDHIAPDTTTAYYNLPAPDGTRPGYYYVNLYKPETRPKWEMMALSLHEAMPGHHLQLAVALELGEIPAFRRYGGYTAFIEGWGLYAESLGEDIGMFDDPYSKFGQLTYEMWRAVRLVVDTGMHSMKWERQKAIDFFMANAPKSELDITNEIDRYITYPGQALAYKIGELKLQELRKRATKELGEKFDLREFHDIVLRSGALPLDILEQNVDAWIEGQK